MKTTQKTISVILCIALFLCSLSGLSFSAGAAGNNDINVFNCESILENKGVNIESLNDVLKNAFASWNTSIDVQSLNIEADDDIFHAIISYCDLYYPENMIAVSGRGYNITSKSGQEYFKTLSFVYCDIIESAENQAKLKSVINELLTGIKGNDNLSDVEKALLIHDRIAMYVDYDNDTYFRTDDGAYVDNNSYHGCGALLNHKGLCGAYAEAYMCLMNIVGIRTDVIKAKRMSHAWNVTMIDNQPYYVDVTWDDGYGDVYHTHFLRSVEGFRDSGHTIDESADWISVCGKPINDSTYDNYYWQDSLSAFQLVDNKIYYINHKTNTLNLADDNHTAVYTAPSKDDFASLCLVGDKLLFSHSGAIYRVNTDTDTLSEPIESLGELGTDSIKGTLQNLSWELKGSELTIDESGRMHAYCFLPIPLRVFVKSVSISEGITNVRDCAIYNCPNLESATIPDSVTDIGSRAFYNCKRLLRVTIPSSVTTIGNDAFEYYRDYDKNDNIKVEGFAITGDENTLAHIYANDNGFRFLKYGEEPAEPTEPTSSEPQPTEAQPTEPASSEAEPTEPVTEAPKPTDIAKAAVSGIKNKTYTGKPVTQSITVKDGTKVLSNGTDYTVTYKNNINSGTATVIINGTGDYTGKITKAFKIAKADNPMTVTAKTKTVKYSAVKKKTVTVSAVTVKKAKGAVSFKKVSADKKITVNTKNGRITLKKGLKKGRYSVKVKVTANGNKNFKRTNKTAKLVVIVK